MNGQIIISDSLPVVYGPSGHLCGTNQENDLTVLFVITISDRCNSTALHLYISFLYPAFVHVAIGPFIFLASFTI